MPVETSKDADVVCPAIIFKVGLTVELPCGPGAKIVKAAFVEVDGHYCAKVTYIAETDSPSRTKTLCEGASVSAIRSICRRGELRDPRVCGLLARSRQDRSLD